MAHEVLDKMSIRVFLSRFRQIQVLMVHSCEVLFFKLIMQHENFVTTSLRGHLSNLQSCTETRERHVPTARTILHLSPATWFNVVLLLIISRFYEILTLDRISYGHLQVLIPINLEDNHWVVARVDFRRKQISIYDSMKEFREEKMYGQLLKSLQVIFPRWLKDVRFYDIQPNLHSAEPQKLVRVEDVPQQQPGSGDCGVFVLMFTMYLMFIL